MNREELLNSCRWKVSYSYACTCRPQCYWTTIRGRHSNSVGTFLNNGEELLGAEAAAALIAQRFGHQEIADIRMWQESAEERDARLARDRREAAMAARGIHWAMGGAN
ncbi:hypothetical protein [Streptomyces alanosinicus]|uniref:Uncharacterized protein n=1 Tax=Streptomyces alanosinicus TaxID=68171 RepID=A0A919D529_9ACTN|nr:hypothetical protein [Streptomyces alanosinicus]GHE09217.1 hypothetical protein GCM10010339_60740 [Streptomyces alanosinicus]